MITAINFNLYVVKYLFLLMVIFYFCIGGVISTLVIYGKYIV